MLVATPEAYQLLHDGQITLAKVEANGICIDTDYLDNAIKDTTEKITTLENRLRGDEVWGVWRKRHGDRANLDSLPQLSEVLFGSMGIPHPIAGEDGLTKTKRYRMDDEVLQKVDLPFVKDYVLLGRLKDDKTKYLGGLKRETINGFFHPNFNLHLAVTYRSSSGSDREDEGRMGKDYNFQNIPTRDPARAKLIRSAFIPRSPNRHIVEVDFKSVEVSIAACYTKDPVLMKYQSDPKTDMHRDTAMQLFGLTEDQVDKKTTRDWSKNRFVFPEFYGSVYFQCAPNIWESASDPKYKLPGGKTSVVKHLMKQGIKELGTCEPGGNPEKGTFEYRVREVENDFWQNRFKVYTEWKKQQWDNYLRTGEFLTLTGFHIGPISKKGMLARNDVTNFGIQGSASHCKLWVMNRLQNWLEKYKMKACIIGEIHDSIIADVPEDEVQDYLDAIFDLISVKLPKAWRWINVPMTAEAEVCPVGESWFTKSGWTRGSDNVWGPEKKAG